MLDDPLRKSTICKLIWLHYQLINADERVETPGKLISNRKKKGEQMRSHKDTSKEQNFLVY